MSKKDKRKTGAAGVEPALTVLETAVLPLNYAPVLASEQPNDIIPHHAEDRQVFFTSMNPVYSGMLSLFSLMCAASDLAMK